MRRTRGPRFGPIAFLACVLVAVAVGIVTYATDTLRELESDSIDARYRLRGEQGSTRSVALVHVDDVTFDELDAQWPFRRSLHARVIDRLRRAGASTIVYDVQFTEPTKAKEDNALIDAVARAGNVVLATTEVDANGSSNVLGGEEVLRSVRSRAGNAIIRQDAGGVLRRFPFEVDGLRGLAVVAVARDRGRRVSRDGFEDGEAWIDFHGPPGTVAAYSFSAVLAGRVPAPAFAGKIVVVGASAPSLKDVHPVPTSTDQLMSGPEVQAHAVSSLLRGLPLRSSPGAVDVVLICLLGLVPLATARMGPRRAVLLTGVVGLSYVAVVVVAFLALGWILPAVHPLLALGIAAVSSLGVHLAVGAVERQRVRDTFARFVPEAVVGEVLACADDELRLGGVQRHATVLFSDLRGFTSFAESRSPAEVIGILNRYLTEMSDAILDHGGTLVAYMGDGIMAVFGSPIERADHAEAALAAAREMAGPRLARFNAWLAEEGFGAAFSLGVGLNSGPVMSGMVGSERRLEYAAVGDTTN
ncbi:MAG TPA: adenylate/guanylate cyclase domain-containing protein, partial [Solirubrobacteraceae bacterium]|nr:adenylate/guanylate cyclase domain-containing protein [Solirubrobacteraceae bacterium]